MTKPIDKVVLLGERKSIVAIATQPAAMTDAERPAVVILNTGIIHRVGHNRMYVALSRELAELGHVVLRLDLSGIGDSEARNDLLDPLAATLADIKDAIDWLFSSRAVKSVVLLGLCSGADHSIVYAGSDPRVAGVVLLDPSVPPTPRYYLQYFGPRLMRSQNWKNFMLGRGRIWRLFARRPARAAPDWSPRQVSIKDPRVRTFLENAYGKAVDDGKQLFAVFTAGLEQQHNYRRQLLDAMRNVRFGSQLRLEYFARCDHTFTFAADRQRLFDMVKAWLRTTTFAAPDKAPPFKS
jgi:alpha-beta hydrolase superfamily lysophospholipase